MSIIDRKAFVAGSAGSVAITILPARLPLDHPFLGTDLIAALKRTATKRLQWHYGDVHEPYYVFDEPHKEGLHRGGFPLWQRVQVGQDGIHGRWLAVIPMLCGGTARATVLAVYVDSCAGPNFAGLIRQGHKQSAFFAESGLHV